MDLATTPGQITTSRYLASLLWIRAVCFKQAGRKYWTIYSRSPPPSVWSVCFWASWIRDPHVFGPPVSASGSVILNLWSRSIGSVCFWASWIRIRIRKLFVRIRILPAINKIMKKSLDFYFFWDFFWLFIFEEWCKCIIKRIRIQNWKKKNTFCWHPEGHWRKEQDQEPEPLPDPLVNGTVPRIRICTKMSRIPGILASRLKISNEWNGKQPSSLKSWLLFFLFFKCSPLSANLSVASIPTQLTPFKETVAWNGFLVY